LRPFIHELRSPVEGALLPGMLAGLNLDLVLAPAESNRINQSKGPAALLRFGACGFPVICSDVVNVPGDLPVTQVGNETQAWISAIEEHIEQMDTCAQRGDALK
ncbi:hypothetical protein, partial [Pseudomonas viridiflava]|uniref:hypothetical protein n=1 Tax=Pseudomonas viridiflava TaxID=33069 RepID=UPI0013DFE76D